ncbi:MAG: hypothetical protein MUO26_12665 [Methanotrichaceae archaeon]|nr:hypothetical protein [Methanotrichaceae archaeon]
MIESRGDVFPHRQQKGARNTFKDNGIYCIPSVKDHLLQGHLNLLVILQKRRDNGLSQRSDVACNNSNSIPPK